MKTQSKITLERRHIQDQEFQIFLEAFNPKKMTPEGLAFYAGSLRVTISGYEHTDVSPIRVPELRIFLQALVKQWGLSAAVHYCDLKSAFFTLLVMSQFNHLCVVEFDQQNQMIVYCGRQELESLALQALQGLWEIGRRAGLKPAVIQRREKQLLNEFFTTFRLSPEQKPIN